LPFSPCEGEDGGEGRLSISLLFEYCHKNPLYDLIEALHNSNKHMVQVSLSGEILPEEKFHVLGFVPIGMLDMLKSIWFCTLNDGQIDSVEQYLSGSRHLKF
jgi:hypothetical protein